MCKSEAVPNTNAIQKEALEWSNKENYFYFSSFFAPMGSAFCSTHRRSKLPLMIVYLQEDAPSCTNTIIPAVQTTVLALGSFSF